LLVHGRWFFPGTPASSTTKTGRHDIAESGNKQNKSINQSIHKYMTSLIFIKMAVLCIYSDNVSRL